MNILLISERQAVTAAVSLGNRRIVLFALLLLLVLPGLTVSFGYYLGGMGKQDPALIASEWEQELNAQRQALAAAKQAAEDNLNALTLRLGRMQAHVIRLDALGQRLTRMAGLEDGEFDFSNAPAQGGPSSEVAMESITVPDFLAQLETLTQKMDDRDHQLQVLESMLMNRNLRAEVYPAGRPIKKGWLSSKFGMRTDPFTGKQDYHKGVDLAGREGSDVIAVASGVVTWAGRRYGYGNLVEINHGNGYVTRYGHNKEIVVKVGETVKKGQLIAAMGSTGRSTGPHVHFEVWVNGKTVDPTAYLAAR